MSKRELLLGAGHERGKRITTDGTGWSNVTALDINPDTKPDVLCDLNDPRLPFKSQTFDEIHAYEVMEHIGRQGDYKFFFQQFDEFARVLKPGGYFFMSSPHRESPWLWGDPGHTRYVGPEMMTFLDRAEYDKQLGKTAMSDYRSCFKSNWQTIFHRQQGESNFIILRCLAA